MLDVERRGGGQKESGSFGQRLNSNRERVDLSRGRDRTRDRKSHKDG